MTFVILTFNGVYMVPVEFLRGEVAVKIISVS